MLLFLCEWWFVGAGYYATSCLSATRLRQFLHIPSWVRRSRGRVCRVSLWEGMQDPSVPALDSWQCAQVWDAADGVDPTARWVPEEALECTVQRWCNEVTLTLDVRHVQPLDLGLFASLAHFTLQPVCYLLSKAANQRCQTRRYTSVMGPMLSKNPTACAYVHEMVVCMLLGNYMSGVDPASRGASRVRLLHTRSLGSAWLLALCDACPLLLMFALRAHLVAVLRGHPALVAALTPAMQWGPFCGVVERACNQLRVWVREALQNPFHPFAQWCPLPGVAVSYPTGWVSGVMEWLEPLQASLADCPYLRAKDVFRQAVQSQPSGPSTAVEEDEWVYLRDVCRQVVVRSVSAPSTRTLHALLCVLLRFGVSPVTVRAMYALAYAFTHHHIPLKMVHTQWARVVAADPRAVHLLLMGYLFVRDERKVQVVGRLPQHYVEAQQRACRERCGLPEASREVLEPLVYVHYCDVCFTVYNAIVNPKSPYKQDFPLGLRDASMDYQSGEWYCQRKQPLQSYRGICGQRPLRKIFALGSVLSIHGNAVIMCPQQGCARLMVVTRDAVYTDRGVACHFCSNRLRPAVRHAAHVVRTYTKAYSCAFCATRVQSALHVVLYPCGLCLCSHHHSAALASHVRVWAETQQMDAPGLQARIVEWIQQRRVAVRDDGLRRDAKQRATFKMMSRLAKPRR